MSSCGLLASCEISLPFSPRKVSMHSKNLSHSNDEVNVQPEISFSPTICNKKEGQIKILDSY